MKLEKMDTTKCEVLGNISDIETSNHNSRQ